MHKTAERLYGALARLPVLVETASVTCRSVPLATYPGGRRPHATVVLSGGGASGCGEHVGWTAAQHHRFRARIMAVPHTRTTVGELSRRLAGTFPEAYDRAAIEAAAIDLALRQQATPLAALAGTAPQPVRTVRSFAPIPDPDEHLARSPGIELKLDVHPAWDDGTLARLGTSGRIAILDWKGSGTPAEHERAHRFLPNALQEDPGDGSHHAWSAGLRARVAIDAGLTRADALDRFPGRPAAANVKPARMGGVLEALSLAMRLDSLEIPFYLGGMFEVGIGRRQLHALAALLCPDGPNDIAPLDEGPPPVGRLVVPPDTIGFGGTTR